MVCINQSVIKVCTDGDATTSINKQNNTPEQNNKKISVIYQPGSPNGTPNTSPTQGQTNETQPTGGNSNNQTSNNNGTTRVINNNGTIINISAQSVILYNIYLNSTQTNNPNNGQNIQNKPNIVVVTPNYVPSDVVKGNNIAADFARFVGGIKQNNPLQFAITKINYNRAYIDNLLNRLNNIAHKLNRIHVFEQRRGNLYQYSVDARGKNVAIHENIRQGNNNIQQSVNIRLNQIRIHEWINANTQTGQVQYSLNIATPKYRLHEYFNGTQANYTYSYDFQRAHQPRRLEGVTVGSAKREGNKYILTPNAYNQRGAVWSREKFDLTRNFTVRAKLYLGNRPQGADGIAFIIQNSPQGNKALGRAGGGLGYRGITNSVAVEFDTWRNRGEINGNHIGFDINGKGYREVPKSIKAFALPQPLESGKEIPVTIKWKYLGNDTGKLIVDIFGKTYEQTYNNISEIFGGTKAYIGFTAATGGERNLQYVSNIMVETQNANNENNTQLKPHHFKGHWRMFSKFPF